MAEGFDAATVTVELGTLSPGEVNVTFRIVEGPPLLIDAIDIDGTLAACRRTRCAPPSASRRATATCAPTQRKAQTEIVRLFRTQGYYEVDVHAKWELGEPHQGILRFTIDPGPLFMIQFSGNQHFSDKHLLGLMDLQTRPIVTDGTWRELARRARRAYQEAGYDFAQVDLRIDPGPPKLVHFEIKEGESYRIADVTFEGNRSLSASTLLAPMATRPPSWIPWRRGVFLEDVFDDDLKRLWYLYRRQGFEDAQIVDAHTRFDAERGKVDVTVFVEEGRQTIVREIVQNGTELLAGKPPELQVVVNQPLDPEQVEADRRALADALARHGYTQAVVTADVSTQPEGDSMAATVRSAPCRASNNASARSSCRTISTRAGA